VAAAPPPPAPGDDEWTSEGMGADPAEITGREKRIVAVSCLFYVYFLYNKMAIAIECAVLSFGT
jgi:hypothetical protein